MVQSHASAKHTANHNIAQKNYNTGTCPLLHCDYCHKNGHTNDRCFKLVGCPKLQNKPRAYNVGTTAIPFSNQLTSTAAPQFTSDQHRQRLQILQAGSSSHLANLAGNLCGSTFSSFNDTWIIDSGATNHIVCSPFFLSSIKPSSPTNLVKLSNGNFTPVLHISTVILSEQITLQTVLCVPTFSYNLIFVQNLISNQQCSIIFFSNHYIFQDHLSRRTIGGGRKHNGLYIFHSPKAVFCIPRS
ncbi:hypothetical protein AMTRI_Chr06g196840 [Amborella trichopoda]